MALREAISPAADDSQRLIINDFQITVATPNGSGSQTSNNAILRALFRMGIPVSGKNLFPSNIQGEPTWYTIRASKEGYIARREYAEVLVAMNPRTALSDMRKLRPDSLILYADDMPMPVDREDIRYYAMPVKQILREANPPRQFRDYLANMVYVGVLAQLLEIELEELENALLFHFNGKRKPVDMNMDVIRRAADWARDNADLSQPYRVRRIDGNHGKLLMDGNTAAALGSVYGGLQFLAWYPITPSSSMAEATIDYLKQLRRNAETGEATYAVVQAEDELAAVGMVLGAGWAGARSMTTTSGPGISLMAEYVGYGYYSEIPAVIWNVQRTGPSTGLPTRVSQGDLMFTHFLSHGDTAHPVLLPGNVEECFEFGWRALDLAERLQTPIFVLSDLDLGMNQWMTDKFEYPSEPLQRGKVLTAEDVDRLGGFGRYKDVDGDGIPYRTLPGTDHPLAAYFNRGSGHDENARYTEDNEAYDRNMQRLRRKFDTAHQMMPKPVTVQDPSVKVGIIGYGSPHPAIQEAQARLAAAGVPTNYQRVRALPFADEVAEFMAAHDRLYVIDLNTDGQMHQLLKIYFPDLAARATSLALNDGLPMTARWVTEAILAKEQGN